MRRAVVVWLLAAPSVAAPAATTLVDDGGRSFRIERPPQRVVSLAPSLTELVYAVGAGAALVAVDTSSDFPPAARALPRVGDAQRVDLERVVALKPDLVLAWRHGNPGGQIARLEALGLPVFQLEPRRLAEVPVALERVGRLLGREADGRAAAHRLADSLDALRTRHAGAAPVAVFHQVWRDPLMTLNGEHLVSDILALCGGRNLFASLAPLVPTVSMESAVATAPQVILSTRERDDGGPTLRREPAHPDFAAWRRFTSVPAVRGGWMFTLSGDTLHRQGPRIDKGAADVCAALDQVRKAPR
jgi:iron complex transport system substrate-binding protein